MKKKQIKEYNEVEYWNKRPDPTSGEGLYQIAYLTYHLKGAKKILDLGPGVGRTLCAYRDAKEVVGIDIASRYTEALMLESMKHNFTFSFYPVMLGELSSLPFKAASFDFAVACQVIMHMKPHYVHRAVLELARVAKEVAVITMMPQDREYDDVDTEYPKDRYCFNYDMPVVCDNMGMETRGCGVPGQECNAHLLEKGGSET